ncbi:hypothetical protein CHGG_02800 [Chaetomium globosum CBS 148.51]|uniref:UTP23 sensor motif region domain-containing protein n=1 Tax=Chaetomium globosum (strain ATCC 6205 / CBS 148.51 / DSM 1962 / NBRC 6347 / NRRL 1970) TaxID=306901 RepID=Q2HAF4_CHAGB|nr:uncharacterized protein CHGG_02800 [Chaetomium globosum CBS 148.51]EAQ90865.1 hypothetical protein CHGG_02800 [Chaetomium globosum CBS 148.51]
MGKRTKQYKKLMRSFEQLGFRQPYQLLMTSDVVLDTTKLDLVSLFEKTLSTKGVKPMITQCCIRALYAKNVGPNRDQNVAAAIERAKTFERRRCGHLVDQDALPERECMLSVVDPKGKGENKFRYVVVTQDELLILEPMSSSSARVREREERVKFLEGIVRQPRKRKRGEDESGEEQSGSEDEGEGGRAEGAARPREIGGEEKQKKKKKQYGRKEPNPLAVKKAKKASEADQKPRKPAMPAEEAPTETKAKRKRRKKASSAQGSGGGGGEGGDTEQAVQAAPASVEAAEA